jgi:stearoyl-CoA desaturase (delta-9 desaturase)
MNAAVRDTSADRRFSTAVALGVIHLGACAAFIPAFLTWQAVAAGAVLFYFTGGIGICLGYHRLLTHRSMRLPRLLEYTVTTIGTLAMQNGPITWVATHRAHHAYSDTDRDPHNSGRGFLWSHIGWMYRRNPARLSRAEERHFAPDLCADPYYRFLNATAPLWQFGLAGLLFACGGLSWIVWGIFVRLVCTYHSTWLVNSAAHLSGYRTFRSFGKDHATNNWFVALLSWGEGWHNNHHAFPFSARHGLRWFEVDVTWWTIRALEAVGLAHDVKLPEPAVLRRRQLATARPAPLP